ncbi:MAG: CBS domain-containing protein [Candidatus Aenigmarchaeota archaeon]|nr:CBS domain-containing protein [Candidatus Aenigmarchaeota archaeon]
MDIKKMLSDAVLIDSETPLSKAISAMESSGKREIIVTKNGEFTGIVDAKDILRKDVASPDKVKIDTLSRKVNLADVERSYEELAGMMLAGDFSEMPFLVDGDIKTLSKASMFRLLDKNIFSGKTARDIMSNPYFVSNDDNLTSVKKLLLDLNVSKTPVVDEENRVIGTVDALNLLNTIISKKKPGEIMGEKIGLEGIKVESFMDREITIVGEDTDLSEIIKKFSNSGMTCILVERNSMLTGIITPKDILKLVGKPEKGGFINLSGYRPEDSMEYEHIKETAKKTLEKLEKMVNVTYAVMHIEQHSKGSVKSLYTVSARLGTNLGLFIADETDWDVSLCVKKAMDKILTAVEKDKEKRRSIRKTRH